MRHYKIKKTQKTEIIQEIIKTLIIMRCHLIISGFIALQWRDPSQSAISSVLVFLWTWRSKYPEVFLFWPFYSEWCCSWLVNDDVPSIHFTLEDWSKSHSFYNFILKMSPNLGLKFFRPKLIIWIFNIC